MNNPKKPVPDDRHNTRRLSRVLAISVSALFAAFGIAGYGRTGEGAQLFLFLTLSVLAFWIVIGMFKGIDRLLDTVDDRNPNDR